MALMNPSLAKHPELPATSALCALRDRCAASPQPPSTLLNPNLRLGSIPRGWGSQTDVQLGSGYTEKTTA